VAIYK